MTSAERATCPPRGSSMSSYEICLKACLVHSTVGQFRDALCVGRNDDRITGHDYRYFLHAHMNKCASRLAGPGEEADDRRCRLSRAAPMKPYHRSAVWLAAPAAEPRWRLWDNCCIKKQIGPDAGPIVRSPWSAMKASQKHASGRTRRTLRHYAVRGDKCEAKQGKGQLELC